MAKREPCLACGATEGPMAFAGEDACSDGCRKLLDWEASVVPPDDLDRLP